MSIYELDTPERNKIREIVDSLKVDEVIDEYCRVLNSLADKACERLRDYIMDEYVLDFEHILQQQARKAVESLLRGENIETMGLKLQKAWSNGREFAYDGSGVRASLVRDFKSDIVSAEMHELMEENKRLKDALDSERRRYA